MRRGEAKEGAESGRSRACSALTEFSMVSMSSPTSSSCFCVSSSLRSTSTCSFCAEANSSLTVLVGSTSNSCVRYAIFMSGLALITEPRSGSRSPTMMDSCVVFPAPLIPTSPTRSPALTSHVTPSSTCWLLNAIATSSRRTPDVTPPDDPFFLEAEEEEEEEVVEALVVVFPFFGAAAPFFDALLLSSSGCSADADDDAASDTSASADDVARSLHSNCDVDGPNDPKE